MQNNQPMQNVYIPYENLPPLPQNINQEQIFTAIQQKFAARQWTENVSAINILRQCNKAFPQSMNSLCEMYWQNIMKCLDHPKTAICKTILIFFQELFANCNVNLNDAIIISVTPKLSLKVQHKTKMVKTEAEKAYQNLTNHCLKESLVVAISESCYSKNPKVSELSFKALFHVLSLASTNIVNMGAETFKAMFMAIKFGLFGKRAELKKQATAICKGLYQVLGEANFSQLVEMMVGAGVLGEKDIKHIREIFTQKTDNKHVSLGEVLKNRRKQNAINKGIHNF